MRTLRKSAKFLGTSCVVLFNKMLIKERMLPIRNVCYTYRIYLFALCEDGDRLIAGNT